MNEVNANWDQAQGQQAMQNILATNADINGVWVQDGMAAGAWRSIMDAGRADEIAATGEIRKDFIDLWTSENLNSGATVNPPGVMASALNVAVFMLEGRELKEPATAGQYGKRHVPADSVHQLREPGRGGGSGRRPARTLLLHEHAFDRRGRGALRVDCSSRTGGGASSPPPDHVLGNIPDMAKLKIGGVSKAYGATVALSHGDLDLEAGEVHVLIGSNGSGKSTLCKIVAGSVKPDKGEVVLDGAPVSVSGPRAAKALGIGIFYQELSMAARRTVEEKHLPA